MKGINKHLEKLDVDHFHHLGIDTETTDVKALFNDVKFVCVSGSSNRIRLFAKFINSHLKVMKDEELVNLCSGDRYVMYKVGPVLMANHGMGVPSTCILLHELFKLLHYAGATDTVFFRIGTCGGIGFEPGTVVVTKRAVDGYCQPKFSQIVMGKLVEHDTEFVNGIAEEIVELSKNSKAELPFDVEIGDTMCCDDFYEGQARLDGALCDYEEHEKNEYLKEIYEKGVRNIEMESTVFAALCNRVGVKGCVVCVVFVNRLTGDQVAHTPEVRTDFEQRPWHVVLEYIKKHLPVM